MSNQGDVSVRRLAAGMDLDGASYVAGVDRGNSHKITKELAFYDADARGVLDILRRPSLEHGQARVDRDLYRRPSWTTRWSEFERRGELLMIWGNGHRLAGERPAATTEPATGEADGSE
jgi:hypothetical protein